MGSFKVHLRKFAASSCAKSKVSIHVDGNISLPAFGHFTPPAPRSLLKNSAPLPQFMWRASNGFVPGFGLRSSDEVAGTV